MKPLAAGLSSLLVAGIVFVAASTSMAPGRWFTSLLSTTTDNAYVRGDVTPISPRISGYITEVAIRDNQVVKAGDVLFRIDDSDYRARVNQAAAGVAMQRALLANLTSRTDLQHASNTLLLNRHWRRYRAPKPMLPAPRAISGVLNN
ncbi:MAG: biotin/lipoyl-binding protein [Mesorhizobium sp.]|uniref:HlyD family secretion protein n=1 Tax=Mesorhizobium sp. TaxID=1871066 RepID=UPI000FE8682E|nr:biotin/lipoyl-binding protein [Mesorhizobium sp.]RWO30965.1 MAG: biotin/lipoyl-binding protein [Mesorhizobium sp.]